MQSQRGTKTEASAKDSVLVDAFAVPVGVVCNEKGVCVVADEPECIPGPYGDDCLVPGPLSTPQQYWTPRLILLVCCVLYGVCMCERERVGFYVYVCVCVCGACVILRTCLRVRVCVYANNTVYGEGHYLNLNSNFNNEQYITCTCKSLTLTNTHTHKHSHTHTQGPILPSGDI